MKQRRWIYAPEFRQQLVELVKAGRKPSELAQEFGCHDTSISVWVRQAKADEQGGQMKQTSMMIYPPCHSWLATYRQ